MNAVYLGLARWIVRETKTELEGAEQGRVGRVMRRTEEGAGESVQDMSEGDALAKVTEKKKERREK